MIDAGRWAVVRLLLGSAQMCSALAAFTLLAQTGVSTPSLAATVVTCVLTTASVLLFGQRSNFSKQRSSR